MTFDDLLASLRWRDDLHIVDLARALLLVCRALEGELRRDLNDSSLVRTFDAMRHSASTFFRSVDGERLDADELAWLIAFLEKTREKSDALTARATAIALDQVLGIRFAGSFSGRSILRLKPRDAFPVHPPTAYELVTRSERSGNPLLRTPALDRLRHLRLAPEDMRGIDVEIVWKSAVLAHLTALAPSSKFAIAHPVSEPSRSFLWRRYERDGVGLFYGVRPFDLEAHWRQLASLIEKAADSDVAVLALPELCLTDELLDRLRGHAQLERIPLLIAGSRHVEASAPGENESVFFAHGIEVGRHQKFRPYEFDDDGDDGGGRIASAVRRREDITPRAPLLRLYVSGGWSVVILICKDAIDRDVAELLRALQVQLVVVPSWSDTTDDYFTLAHALAADPQTVTLVANVPAAAEASAALFGRPVRDAHRRVTAAAIERPKLLWFDLSGNSGSSDDGEGS